MNALGGMATPVKRRPVTLAEPAVPIHNDASDGEKVVPVS